MEHRPELEPDSSPSKTTPPRIYLFSTVHTSFFRSDAETLRQCGRLTTAVSSGVRALFQIMRDVPRSDIVMCWFASTYSAWSVFLARRLNIPAVLFIGGVDAAKESEIGYGIWLTPWKARFVGYAVRNANAVLVVDPSLGDALRSLAGYTGDNISYLPFGYDPEFWTPSERKEPIVLTAAMCDTRERALKKGLDRFLSVAHRLPHEQFILVGTEAPRLTRFGFDIPANVEVVGEVDPQVMRTYYRRAKVYCQLSRHEGLPNALCEAMLCGCIPVGTSANGIPTAIGDAGYIVRSNSLDDMMNSVQQALARNDDTPLRARQRIIDHFPMGQRRDALRSLVRRLTRFSARENLVKHSSNDLLS